MRRGRVSYLRMLETSSSTSHAAAAITTTETAPTIEAPTAPLPASRTQSSTAGVGEPSAVSERLKRSWWAAARRLTLTSRATLTRTGMARMITNTPAPALPVRAVATNAKSRVPPTNCSIQRTSRLAISRSRGPRAGRVCAKRPCIVFLTLSGIRDAGNGYQHSLIKALDGCREQQLLSESTVTEIPRSRLTDKLGGETQERTRHRSRKPAMALHDPAEV